MKNKNSPSPINFTDYMRGPDASIKEKLRRGIKHYSDAELVKIVKEMGREDARSSKIVETAQKTQ